MFVNELFYSLQGEGRLSGVPSVFVRLAGCPLRCRWCDTKYAWDFSAGENFSPEQILEQIRKYPTRYVVVTGGEPMVNPELGAFTCLLHRHGYHLTIETAGIQSTPDLVADLMSISPKLANSSPDDPQMSIVHDQMRLNLDSLQRLIETYSYQLKFVVDCPDDLDQVAQCLEQLKDVDPYNVYLMPQAVSIDAYLSKSKWLAEYCLRCGFSFTPRLQVMLWQGTRGK